MAKFSTSQDEILINEIQKYSAIYDYENEHYKNFIIKENAWKKVAFSVKREVDDCKKRWKSIKDTYFRHKRRLQMGTGSAALDKPVKWNLYQHLSFLDKVKHERSSKQTLDFEPMTYVESEIVEVNECSLDLDDISNPSTSRGLEVSKSNPVVPHENDTTSTTSVSRCSSAASSTPVSTKSNIKRFRCNNVRDRDTYLTRSEERSQKRTEILEALHNSKQAAELDEIDLFMKSISLTIKKLPQPVIDEAKLGILTLVTKLRATAMSSSNTSVHHPSTNTSLGDFFQTYSPQPQEQLSETPNSRMSTTIESPDMDYASFQEL